MTVKCAQCGEQFEAERKNATYCGARCRKRASRAKGAQVIDLTSKRQRRTAPPEPTDPPVVPPLVIETERALQNAGQLDTVLGQQALALARRMAAPGETSVASLSREFRAVMDAALSKDTSKVNPVEQLRNWRERKHPG